MGLVMQLIKKDGPEIPIEDLNKDSHKLKQMIQNRKILNQKLQLVIENSSLRAKKATIKENRNQQFIINDQILLESIEMGLWEK